MAKWDMYPGLDRRHLIEIANIKGMPIPDVTIRGRDYQIAAHHFVDEIREVRERLDAKDYSEQMIAEVLDSVILGLSVLHLYSEEQPEGRLAQVISFVLYKNAIRGYYDTDEPLSLDNMSSESADNLREIGWNDG